MVRDVLYIALGYLFGSILFAKVFCSLLKKTDVTENTDDKNPGTYNAFHNGGFLCGALTLCGDLLKGFLPVFLYLRGDKDQPTMALALVMAAPVIGHVFSVFSGFSGGKGIAATFGCLLGLLPWNISVIYFALIFIFFSVVLRITPHYYRTVLTYLCMEAALLLLHGNICVTAGFTLILISVGIRMLTSKEEKGPIGVKLLWMR